MQTWEVFALFKGEGDGQFMTLFRVKEGETPEGVKAKLAARGAAQAQAAGTVRILHGTLMVDTTPVDFGVTTN